MMSWIDKIFYTIIALILFINSCFLLVWYKNQNIGFRNWYSKSLDNNFLQNVSSPYKNVESKTEIKHFTQILGEGKVGKKKWKKRNCTLWENISTFPSSSTPQIMLDPNKFLYPGLIWGPNNQIVGLWQATYLAIRLNRTIVLPKFFTHYTVGETTIPTIQRIDVERLCRLISCISIKKFRQKCNKEFDVVLQAQVSSTSDIKRFEKDTGMNILSTSRRNETHVPGATTLRLRKSDLKPNIPTFPDQTYTLTYQPWLPSDGAKLREAYNTTERCALYDSPFYQIRTKLKDELAVNLKSNNVDANAIADDIIYSAVVSSIRFPRCINEAANEFLALATTEVGYAAVHWRYDERDWGKTCGLAKKQKLCAGVANITAMDIAVAINESITPFLRKIENNSNAIVPIYIATPPSLTDFKSKILKQLKNINEAFKVFSLDLKIFLVEAGFEDCWNDNNWSSPDEIFSLIEMEIMRKSEFFFYSPGSTWSSNIRPLRWKMMKDGKIEKKFEASIFNLANNVMTKREK